MTSVVSRISGSTRRDRADALADVLEQGARALASFASGLSNAEWQTRGSQGRRKVGVVVHHVATMYPLEIQLAQTLAGGNPVTGVTWDDVHAMNAAHAKEYDAVTKEEALALLETQQRGGRGGDPCAERRGACPGPRRSRCTPMLRSRASSCWRTTPSGTAITTSQPSGEP